MKTYLSLITAAALALSACGENKAPAAPSGTPPASAAPASPAAPAPASEAAAPASAAASAPVSGAASAECSVEIVSDDAMKFQPREIAVKSSCAQFSITLKHVGKMPKAAMGHNVVLTKAADVQAVLADGAGAGVAADYLKAGDSRVIAATKMIGGGESDTITLDVAKLAKGEAYEYFCSFPSHYAQMNGKLTVTD